MVPVQGRVGVRESKAPTQAAGTSNSSPGVVTLDDGDITLVCQACQRPSGLTGGGPLSGQPESPAAGGRDTTGSKAAPGSTAVSIKMIIIAALVAPTGLALIVVGALAVVMKRRKKQKEDASDSTQDEKRLHKHKSGRPGRPGHPELQQGVKHSWRSTDGGDSWYPRAGPATLRRSTNGASWNGSNESTDGEASPPHGHGTQVEGLQPGETGFGSMPGGIYRPGAILPPTRDSMDLYAGHGRPGMPVAGHRPPASGARGNRWSLAGSLAGMATSVANVLHLRWVLQSGVTVTNAGGRNIHLCRRTSHALVSLQEAVRHQVAACD
jgi:hypothetical protein